MMAISAAAVAGAVMGGAVVIAMLVLVMVAVHIGVEIQLTGDQSVHRVIRAALHAAVKPDAGLLERRRR